LEKKLICPSTLFDLIHGLQRLWLTYTSDISSFVCLFELFFSDAIQFFGSQSFLCSEKIFHYIPSVTRPQVGIVGAMHCNSNEISPNVVSSKEL